QLAGEVRAVLCLVGEQRADAGGHPHGRVEPAVGGARAVLQQPHVAEDDAPVAYRKADAAAVHPRLRRARDAYRAPGAGDAEALEPGADGGRGAPGEDRAGAHRVERGRIEVALAVVGAE